MDKTQIIDELKHTNEILPNEYDGTYRSVRETVECYAKLRKTALLDYTDLELLYFLSLGIWNSDKSERKSRLEKSHLLYNDKITLERSLERIWCNGSKKLFTHRISDDELKVLTETVAFKDTDMAKNAEAVQFFIKMCINLAGLEKDSELYDTAQKMLNAKIKNAGIPIYVVSRILHSLKPFSFPIFANTKEHCEIYRTMLRGISQTAVKSGLFATRTSNSRICASLMLCHGNSSQGKSSRGAIRSISLLQRRSFRSGAQMLRSIRSCTVLPEQVRRTMLCAMPWN